MDKPEQTIPEEPVLINDKPGAISPDREAALRAKSDWEAAQGIRSLRELRKITPGHAMELLRDLGQMLPSDGEALPPNADLSPSSPKRK